MKKTSKKIVFFGNERLATGVTTTAPTFRALISMGYEISALVSSYRPARSRSSREPEIHQLAKDHSVPLLLPNKMIDIIDDLKDLNAEIGVLVAFGKIIPQAIIDVFPKGIINIHPSLLPLHRGPTPIESVILAGEKTTGVSIMELAKKMDSGPVYAQLSENINSNKITKQDLADSLLTQGSQLLINTLPRILSGTLKPIPQNDSTASYDSQINKKSAQLDIINKSATQLDREIRAYANWPGSRIKIAGKEVIIVQSHVANYEIDPTETPKPFVGINNTLCISTKKGVLVIDTLKPIGKKEMTAAAFLAGYKNKL